MYRIVLTLVLGFAAASPPQLAAQGVEETAVRAVAAAFGQALAAGDSTAALALLHPDVVIFEGGRWESLSEYRSGHLRGDMAYLQAVKQATLRGAVTIMGDFALVTSESSTTGTYRERAVDSIGVETLVLLRTVDGWRIRHIHWSSRARSRPGG